LNINTKEKRQSGKSLRLLGLYKKTNLTFAFAQLNATPSLSVAVTLAKLQLPFQSTASRGGVRGWLAL